MKLTITTSQAVKKAQADKNIVTFTLARKQKETETFKDEKGRKKIIIGIEKPAEINQRKLVILARKAVRETKKIKAKKVLIDFNDFNFPKVKLNTGELAEVLAVNFEMANYEFIRYKKKPKIGWDTVEEVLISGVNKKDEKVVKNNFKKGQTIGEAVNGAREWSNIPGGDMTPQLLADETKKLFKGTKAKVKILEKKDMEKLGMNGVLAVARGSDLPPKFIIVEYFGAGDKKEKPFVLVGKGVTFDTGGIHLKPTGKIEEEHLDMCGAAAIIQAMASVEKLGVKKNVVGLIPAVENMVSGSSFRPGDVIWMSNGKTVEIGNTDAEGRLVVAEGLTYAQKYNPSFVVDVATLTGASIITLGKQACAVLSIDEKYHDKMRKLGEESGDYTWPLPLWEEYESDLECMAADLNSIGKSAPLGQTIISATFLKYFVGKHPWIHIESAPRRTVTDSEELAKGAAGAPVRLLVRMLEKGI